MLKPVIMPANRDTRLKSNHKLFEAWMRWSQKVELDPARRRRLKSALDRAVIDDLPERDSAVQVYARTLPDAGRIGCVYETDILCCYPNRGGDLVVATIMPAWRGGWRDISCDQIVSEWLRDFFFFGTQYVARSRILPVIASLALTYQLALDFRPGSGCNFFLEVLSREYATWQERLRTEHSDPSFSGAERGNAFAPWAGPLKQFGRRQAEFAAWIAVINGLDPFIHRAAFQYWRAIRLRRAGFDVEAINALDSFSSVVVQYCSARAGTREREAAMRGLLGLGVTEWSRLSAIHDVRNSHAAHPSFRDWWDLEEMYGDLLDEGFVAAKTLFVRLCRHERDNRVVHPNPLIWSQWICEYGDLVFDAVWYS